MVSLPDIRTSFLIHLASSFILLGIVLITQFVTYPMYQILPQEDIIVYQSAYLVRAFLLIGPIMVIELLTGIHLAMKVKDFNLHSFIRADMSIIIAIWIITFVMELPAHYFLLNNGVSPIIYRTVLFGNLFRLIAWAIKSWYVLRMVKFFYQPNQNYENLT